MKNRQRVYKVLLTGGFLTVSTCLLFAENDAKPTEPEPTTISIWEAAAKEMVEIRTAGSSTRDRSFSTLTIENTGTDTVSMEEHLVILSPHPLEQPGSAPTTQDMVLLPGQLIPGGSERGFISGSVLQLEKLAGLSREKPSGSAVEKGVWWCIEKGQWYMRGVPILLGGEILPNTLLAIVRDKNPDDFKRVTERTFGIEEGKGVLKNYRIWDYMHNHSCVVVGKTPLWTGLEPGLVKNVDVRIAVTNLGHQRAGHTRVRDRVPPGFNVDIESIAPEPYDYFEDPDEGTVIEWLLEMPPSLETEENSPNERPTLWLEYNLLVPGLEAGERLSLPPATVDSDGIPGEDARSARPLLEATRLPESPEDTVGSGVEINAPESPDPDHDHVGPGA